MLVSKKHKVAFIHAQKNGGTSIEAILKGAFPDCRLVGSYHGPLIRSLPDLGPTFLRRYYVFTFVRNPWDRMVSWWTWLQTHENGRPIVRESAVGVPFETVIREQIGKRRHRILARTQVEYLCNAKGKIVVPHIFRFENFEAEAKRLCAELGINCPEIPRRNATEHKHYSTYYTPETRQIVADRFAPDIAEWGYAFEESP